MSKIKSWIVSTGKWIGYTLVGATVVAITSTAVTGVILAAQWALDHFKIVIGVAFVIVLIIAFAFMGREIVRGYKVDRAKKKFQQIRSKK